MTLNTIDVFTACCFAYPILSTTKSIIKDNKFMALVRQKTIESKTWKMKDGTLIELAIMSDSHLSNAIKMVARNCHKEIYLGEMKDDKLFLKLVAEAKRRKLQVLLLNTPIEVDGRKEYVEVFILQDPSHRNLSTHMLSTDWDSRLEE